MGHKLVIPVLMNWKHVGPWAAMSSQPSLLGKLWTNERPCLKKNKKGRWLPKKPSQMLTSVLHMHMHTLTWAPVSICVPTKAQV